MKRFSAAGLLGILFILGGKASFAQNSEAQMATIAPYEIAVGYHQTTNLIFPYTVKSVDIGSDAVLAQKAKGVENILQIKAGTEQFAPTNISVVTADGKFYSFLLSYVDNPPNLNISFAGSRLVKLADDFPNKKQLEQEAWQVAAKRSFMHLAQNTQSLGLGLNGIFYSESNLWMKLDIANRSQVDFQPAQLRFFLRDKKQVKRTALNETEIFPWYMSALNTVNGRTASVFVVGFKPFTVPKRQRLIMQISDESAGRMVVLPIKSRFFLRAHKLR